MSSANVQCGFCDLCYDEKNRIPLMLHCGHSFCKVCLLYMELQPCKQCPTCLTQWDGRRVCELPVCHQLVPEPSLGFGSFLQRCQKHSLDMKIWCESCRDIICIKCFRSSHLGCTWKFLEEKWSSIELFQKYGIKAFKEGKIADISKWMSTNQENLLVVKKIKEKFQDLEHKLSDDLKSLVKSTNEAWPEYSNYEYYDGESAAAAAAAAAAAWSFSSRSKMGLDLTRRKLDAIELPPMPTSLLMRIALSYQESENEDTKDFISKVGSLQIDSENWKIQDKPSALKIARGPRGKSTTWDGVDADQFLKMIPDSNFDLRVLSCTTFLSPSQSSVTMTNKILDTVLELGERANVIEFWGHLDAAGVKRLPSSLHSLKLALRTAEDMQAVNALWKTAFESIDDVKKKVKKSWVHLKELHLSIVQPFRSEHWKLMWLNENSNSLLGIESLYDDSIQLYVHLPQVSKNDHRWLASIIDIFTKDRNLKLFIWKTAISLDALLGILSDCKAKCEVHIPPSDEGKNNREIIMMNYMRQECSIHWDLELC